MTGRLQGRSDVLLTDLGVRQVEEALERLPSFGRVISSPLRRALDTAMVVAKANEVAARVDVRLIERSWGVWEGLTPEEVESESPGAFAREEVPDGFEFSESVVGRVSPLVEEVLTSSNDQEVLLVTHGGLMLDLVTHLGGEPTRFKNLEGQWISRANGILQIEGKSGVRALSEETRAVNQRAFRPRFQDNDRAPL